jgi:hypothetical protein
MRGALLAVSVAAAGCVAPSVVRHHDTPAPETVTNAAYRGDPFLADVESRSFEYFWRTTDARTGLTPDRSPSPSFSSIAAIGFALTAYPIGVSEGYVTREQAAERTLTTLRTLYELPQGPADTGVSGYKGFYYHFLNMDNAHRCWPARCSASSTSMVPRRPRPGSGRTPIRCTRESTGSGPPRIRPLSHWVGPRTAPSCPMTGAATTK